MSEEVLIPKMKRIDKTKRKIKIPVLNFVIVLFCTLLLISSTFLNLCIKHYIIPFDIFSNKNLTIENFIYCTCFIPQVPMVMFVCSILGKRMALTSVILYLIAGLCFIPVFALGGGFRYFFEYSFGYILAYIPATAICGNLLGRKYTFPDMIKAVLAGGLTIHIIGILYMVIIALFKHTGSTFISGWIEAQSGLKIIYDLVISFVLVLIGKYIHSALKFIME